jgi:hypothetical protein
VLFLCSTSCQERDFIRESAAVDKNMSRDNHLSLFPRRTCLDCVPETEVAQQTIAFARVCMWIKSTTSTRVCLMRLACSSEVGPRANARPVLKTVVQTQVSSTCTVRGCPVGNRITQSCCSRQCGRNGCLCARLALRRLSHTRPFHGLKLPLRPLLVAFGSFMRPGEVYSSHVCRPSLQTSPHTFLRLLAIHTTKRQRGSARLM